MLLALLTTAVTTALALLAAVVARLALTRSLQPVEKNTIGFFHPFADGGGGGERVLWCAVRAVLRARPDARVLIYVRERAPTDGSSSSSSSTTPPPPINNNTPASLSADARRRFGVDLPADAFEVVPLTQTHLIDPRRYPSWTLARQAFGSALLAREALAARPPPELWVDTTGWAFAYPLARLAGCRVACYVHYPTVSSDMVARVARREGAFNNAPAVASSRLRSALKVFYYRLVALIYGACGGLGANVAMVNSSWTLGHVQRIWGPWAAARRLAERVVGLVGIGGQSTAGGANDNNTAAHLVYPPCDVSRLASLPLDRALKRLSLVSVAQFRPEKDHATQLEAYARLMRAADAALNAASGGGANNPNADLLGGLLPPPGSVGAQADPTAAGGMGACLREWRRRRRLQQQHGRRQGGGDSVWAGGDGGDDDASGGGGGGSGLLWALSSWLFGSDDSNRNYFGDDDDAEEEEHEAEEEDQDDDEEEQEEQQDANGSTTTATTPLGWLSWLSGGAFASSNAQQLKQKKKQQTRKKKKRQPPPTAAADDEISLSCRPLAPSPPLPPLVLTPSAARAARASCLRFVGSCRGPDDAARLAALKRRAERLGVAARCSWHENVDSAELARLLGSAVGGLHSMRDEHFGIGVVEYMAAGAVPVAHDSGGPRADIVVAGWVPSRGVVVGADGGAAGGRSAGGRSPLRSSGGGASLRSWSSSGGSKRSPKAASAAPTSSLVGRLAGAAPWASGLWRRPSGSGATAAAAAVAAANDVAAAAAAAAGGIDDESYDMVDDAPPRDGDEGGLLDEDDDDDYEEEDADLFEGPDVEQDGSDDGNGNGSSGGGVGNNNNDAALRLSSASRARDERRARRTAARRRGRRRGTPPVVGFLATGVDELAWAMARCLALGEKARRRVAAAGRRRAAALFSDARFEEAFLRAVGPVLPSSG